MRTRSKRTHGRLPCAADGCRSTVPVDSLVGLCQVHAVAEIVRLRSVNEALAEQLRLVAHRGHTLLSWLRSDHSRSATSVRSSVAERAREFIVLAWEGLIELEPGSKAPEAWVNDGIELRKIQYAELLGRIESSKAEGT